MRSINLDHQAATPVAPEVLAAMLPWFDTNFGNPSSLHQGGTQARQAIDQARTQVAALIRAPSPDQIIFTGSGTEALNLAVKGAAWASRRQGSHIVVSAIEHPAILRSVEFLQSLGFTATRLPVDREGFLDPSAVRAAITSDTILVCVHHANHDVGTIEPIQDISAITADAGIPLLVDAVASAGWVNIDVENLGASFLALSPHRFHGPKGVGILYRARNARLIPLVHGGSQESGRHAGTENVPAIVGAGAAAARIQSRLPQRVERVRNLQARLWNGIQSSIPSVQLNGPPPGPHRLPAALSINIEGVEGEGMLLNLDLQGLAIASGSACLSRSVRIPPVLAALGLDPAQARGNIFLSLGEDNTEEEVDLAVASLARTAAHLRGLSPSWGGS
jgi:cysteine desulfurase